MRVRYSLAGLSLSVLLPACAAIEGAGEVVQGREALFTGNYPATLSLFQSAEEVDPEYVYGTELREGVLSYLGRAQYLNGDYAQARQILEKALARDNDDNIAGLYAQEQGRTSYPPVDIKETFSAILSRMAASRAGN